MSVRAGFEEYAVSASPRLIRTARLLIGDVGVAEDLAQETLVLMYRHWRRIRSADAVHAYAHRTIVRLARRHLRRASSRLEIIAEAPGEGGEVIETPDREAHVALLAALAGLPPRQREALVLRYFLDLSVDDSATAMGCRPGTVKSQSSKALAKLRAQLGAESAPQRAGDPS